MSAPEPSLPGGGFTNPAEASGYEAAWEGRTQNPYAGGCLEAHWLFGLAAGCEAMSDYADRDKGGDDV